MGLVDQLLLPGGVGRQGLEVSKTWPEVSLWTLPGGRGVLLAGWIRKNAGAGSSRKLCASQEAKEGECTAAAAAGQVTGAKGPRGLFPPPPGTGKADPTAGAVVLQGSGPTKTGRHQGPPSGQSLQGLGTRDVWGVPRQVSPGGVGGNFAPRFCPRIIFIY